MNARLLQSRRVHSALAILPFALMASEAIGQTTIRYIHTDALGSPVAASDLTGNIINFNAYDPYGKPLTNSGEDTPGFAGHVTDASTGFSYMQQRYYDGDMGRFVSTDPITPRVQPLTGFNRYRYANNNPYSMVDPDGRRSTPLGEAYLRHYYRNALNTAPPDKKTASTDTSNWRELSREQSVFHRQGEGEENNTKWVDMTGHNEAVYDGDGNLITDRLNGGTYNYFSPDEFIGHAFFDILPYILWGNGPIAVTPADLDASNRIPVVTIGEIENPDQPTPAPEPPPERELRNRF